MIRIVSDLHIEDAHDPTYRSLLRLMDGTAPCDELVLAGDIFDFMVGRPLFLRSYPEFFASLSAAIERGVKIHYIEGNHDVNLLPLLRRIPGVSLHRAEMDLQVHSQKLFIAHGDLADRNDWGYRFWRWLVRTWPVRSFFKLLPSSAVMALGRKLSELSRSQRTHRVTPEDGFARVRPIYRSYAAEKAKLGFDYIVMGHCHDLDEMGFTVDGRNAKYMNVGYPKAHGSYVVCDEDGLRREPLPSFPQ